MLVGQQDLLQRTMKEPTKENEEKGQDQQNTTREGERNRQKPHTKRQITERVNKITK